MYYKYTKNPITLWILEVLCVLLIGSCAGQPYHTPDIISNKVGLTNVTEDNEINPREYKADPDDTKPLYDIARDITNPDEAKNARNLLQSRMLILSDRVTEEHLSSIFATEDASNVGLGIATIALSSIGTAVSPASTKTGLSAAASITEGSRSIINEEIFSNAFAEAITKTIRAIRRVEKLRLEIKRRKNIEEYNVEDAIHDAIIYHQMGSFYHGLELVLKATHREIDDIEKRFIEPLENRVNPEADISRLSPVTGEDVTRKESLTEAIGNLKDSDLQKAAEALKLLESTEPAPANIEEAKIQLQRHIRRARSPEEIKELANVFQKANIMP